jgi:hypothetical protein
MAHKIFVVVINEYRYFDGKDTKIISIHQHKTRKSIIFAHQPTTLYILSPPFWLRNAPKECKKPRSILLSQEKIMWGSPVPVSTISGKRQHIFLPSQNTVTLSPKITGY